MICLRMVGDMHLRRVFEKTSMVSVREEGIVRAGIPTRRYRSAEYIPPVGELKGGSSERNDCTRPSQMTPKGGVAVATYSPG
jgi:hypothetical protein